MELAVVRGLRGVILRSRGVVRSWRSVVSSSGVSDFGNKSRISVGMVVDSLKSTIRKEDVVRSFCPVSVT
jgi:hypothetical protein